MLATSSTRWDRTADVVVVGYGLAGAVAAITARDRGASVLVLEKETAGSHFSNSSLSEGMFLCPRDPDGAAAYLDALYRNDERTRWTDLPTIRAWAEYACQNVQWLKSLGGSVSLIGRAAEFPHLPGADSIEVWHFAGNGLRLMQFMDGQLRKRNIEVMYQTPAQRLLTDEHGAVIGVHTAVSRDGKPANASIRAARAAVLCCGGFEHNEQMKLQYLRVHPVFFTGSPANTGDGIRMAQDVGAELWHMNCCSARLAAKFEDFPYAFTIDFGGRKWARRQFMGISERASAGFIIVDKYGRRYTSENFKFHALFYELTSYDTHRLEFPRVPSYWVFDQRRMDSGPLAPYGAAGAPGLYRWSLDNVAELRRGWIASGETVGQLADRIGMPPTTLENTIATWNQHCRSGNDPEHGRNPLELVPLDQPPFYAVRLFPGGPNTFGGPRRNHRAQIVDPFGQPIPGLYGAGECGSIYGMLYPVGGGNLAECIAFGRIAGENAAGDTVG